MNIIIEKVAAATNDVRDLLLELDRALAGPYSEDQQHALSFEELFQPGVIFFLARLNGLAVGCGGVAFFDGYAELKRMYCRPSARGQGVAQALLRDIESATRQAERISLRLETGVYQQAAIKFYERNGFSPREPFGPYAQMRPQAIERSVFYEKSV
jgi:putative acetyltransferase